MESEPTFWHTITPQMAKVSQCGSLDEGLKVEARQPSSSRNTERVLFGRELAEKNLKTYSNQESIPTSGYGESNVIV